MDSVLKISDLPALAPADTKNSRNPHIFGPIYWKCFHNLAYNYPDNPDEETQKSCKMFLTSLIHLLPCTKCRNHYDEYFKSQNINRVCSSRDELFKYFHRLHNIVNKRNGKPEMSFADAVAQTSGTSDSCDNNIMLINSDSNNNGSMYISIGFMILFAIIIYMCIRRSSK